MATAPKDQVLNDLTKLAKSRADDVVIVTNLDRLFRRLKPLGVYD